MFPFPQQLGLKANPLPIQEKPPKPAKKTLSKEEMLTMTVRSPFHFSLFCMSWGRLAAGLMLTVLCRRPCW